MIKPISIKKISEKQPAIGGCRELRDAIEHAEKMRASADAERREVYIMRGVCIGCLFGELNEDGSVV